MKDSYVRLEHMGLMGRFFAGLGLGKAIGNKELQLMVLRLSVRVVTNGVLGVLLFLIYINDLDNGISSDISKFADDSKISRIIRSESDVKDLQEIYIC